MTSITWDEVGERRFYTGIDRGVLYPPTGPGVAWNGLTSIEESGSRESKALYLDGIKYLEYQTAGTFEGKLKALTYPEEFDTLNGTEPHSSAEGLYVHEQPPRRFGLCYRTILGNDVAGVDFGYTLTVLYNLMAVPEATAFSSLNDKLAPEEFGWALSGIPVNVTGARPTVRLSFNSTKIDADKLSILEDILYGSATSEPRLPNPEELIAVLDSDYVILILDHGDGSWSAYGPDDRFSLTAPGQFQITNVDATVIDANSYTVTTTLT